MASRSSVDATRFTATEPHAYSQPTPLRSSIASSPASSLQPLTEAVSKAAGSTNGPPNPGDPQPLPRTETPKEKVARLRAARLAQRNKQLTTWERTVIRGRAWADRVHRLTALSVIGFSVIAVGVTVFAFTDMILHNRRKRAAFYKAQHAIYQARVVAAIETERAGLPLDEDQVLVLARERAKVQAEERKKEQGWLGGVTTVLTGNFKKDMEPIVVPSESQILKKLGVNSIGVLEASEGKEKVNERGEVEGVQKTNLARAVRQKRREIGLEEDVGPAEITVAAEERRGGMLDRIGERAVSDATAKNNTLGGWLK